MRAFLAARVWASVEGPRALFDRAVVWLVDDRVLLPGITTLTRLVAETRAQKMAELYRTLDAAVPGELRQAMRELLRVPHGKRVSELERLRSGPVRVSGAARPWTGPGRCVRSARAWWTPAGCRRRGWRRWPGTGWARRRPPCGTWRRRARSPGPGPVGHRCRPCEAIHFLRA